MGKYADTIEVILAFALFISLAVPIITGQDMSHKESPQEIYMDIGGAYSPEK